MEYRTRIADFIRQAAQPPDKFSHQPRLYALCKNIADGLVYDDEVLYASAWLHDLGVFVGHRPECPQALASWDNVAYAVREAPGLLAQLGFPHNKVNAVVASIQTHLPADEPRTAEGILLRDGDILEQLGATGILRIVSKVGRDTRYPTHAQAICTLQKNLATLPAQLRLSAARRLAESRVETLRNFLLAAEVENQGIEL